VNGRPLLRLPADEPDQVPRLRQFRSAHPDVVVEKGEFGTWQARIPEENGGERFVCRHGLEQLLDRLCELLAEPRRRSR
jgi:hypothetical protein